MVYGANDGIITTFAVVASVEGAHLGRSTILIIGLASLIGDGISMAASNYLGSRSESALLERSQKLPSTNPIVAASMTFIAFIIAGSLPLLPYLLFFDHVEFIFSAISTGLALIFVGAARTYFSKRNMFLGAIEMLVIGGGAAMAAYFIGNFVSTLF